MPAQPTEPVQGTRHPQPGQVGGYATCRPIAPGSGGKGPCQRRHDIALLLFEPVEPGDLVRPDQEWVRRLNEAQHMVSVTPPNVISVSSLIKLFERELADPRQHREACLSARCRLPTQGLVNQRR